MANGSNAFERAVARYLTAGLHELRGMSADEYRNRCRELWDTCEVDAETPYLLLIDELMPIHEHVVAGEYDYNDARVGQLAEAERADKRDVPSLRCVAAGLFDLEGSPADPAAAPDSEDKLRRADPSLPNPYMIGFFDVLGFRGWLERTGLPEVLTMFRSVIDKAVVIPSMRCLGVMEIAPGRGVPTLFALPAQHAYFSDTIVVWAPLVKLFVAPFVARCADLICESLTMGVPLRGAVSIGVSVMDKDTGTYLGRPIVEAAGP